MDHDLTVSYFDYVSYFAAKCQLLKFKCKNQQYDNNALDRPTAVKDVSLNKVTMREASREFDLPVSTLHRYVMQHKHVDVTRMVDLNF